MFVDAFLANYAAHLDFAKPSKFMALIFQPTGLIAGGLFSGLIGGNQLTKNLGKGINTAGLSFSCEQAVLPGYQINTVEQKVYGAPFTGAATPVFEPLQLQFICSGDMWERKFFEDWMELILPKQPQKEQFSLPGFGAFGSPFTPDSGSRPPFTAKYRNEYVSTIEVIQFHDTGIPSARYKFEECYPVDMNPQPLSWDNTDIHRLTTTFHYRTWRREENFLKQLYSEFTNP